MARAVVEEFVDASPLGSEPVAVREHPTPQRDPGDDQRPLQRPLPASALDGKFEAAVPVDAAFGHPSSDESPRRGRAPVLRCSQGVDVDPEQGDHGRGHDCEGHRVASAATMPTTPRPPLGLPFTVSMTLVATRTRIHTAAAPSATVKSPSRTAQTRRRASPKSRWRQTCHPNAATQTAAPIAAHRPAEAAPAMTIPPATTAATTRSVRWTQTSRPSRCATPLALTFGRPRPHAGSGYPASSTSLTRPLTPGSWSASGVGGGQSGTESP